MQGICGVIQALITSITVGIVTLCTVVLIVSLCLIFAVLMVLAGLLLVGAFLFIIVWEFFQGIGQWLKRKTST